MNNSSIDWKREALYFAITALAALFSAYFFC